MNPDQASPASPPKEKPQYHAVVDTEGGPSKVSAKTKQELKKLLGDPGVKAVHYVFRGRPVAFNVGRAVSF